jgi:hypothetical protein
MTADLEKELKERGGLSHVLKRIAHPNWDSAGALRDWRHCVPPTIAWAWESLTVEAKVVAYLMAESHQDGDSRV